MPSTNSTSESIPSIDLSANPTQELQVQGWTGNLQISGTSELSDVTEPASYTYSSSTIVGDISQIPISITASGIHSYWQVDNSYFHSSVVNPSGQHIGIHLPEEGYRTYTWAVIDRHGSLVEQGTLFNGGLHSIFLTHSTHDGDTLRIRSPDIIPYEIEIDRNTTTIYPIITVDSLIDNKINPLDFLPPPKDPEPDPDDIYRLWDDDDSTDKIQSA